MKPSHQSQAEGKAEPLAQTMASVGSAGIFGIQHKRWEGRSGLMGRGLSYSLQVHPPDVLSHIHMDHFPSVHSVVIKKPKWNSWAL